MSDDSHSEHSDKKASEPREIAPNKACNKLFITSLPGNGDKKQIEEQLRKVFSVYGKIQNIITKSSYQNEYHFAFVQYEEGVDASPIVTAENGKNFMGKAMKVDIQDNRTRRKDQNSNCFFCQEPGHYAKNCDKRKKIDKRSYRDRSRSRDRRHKKRHYSSSSQSSRKAKIVRTKIIEDKSRKKDHSKKKHSKGDKKSRKYSDSDSSSR